jgi:hypothetical protein
MTGAKPQPATPQTVMLAGRQYTIERAELAVRNSASWFLWIAGLSVLNSLISIFDAPLTMAIGLGVTQFVDAIAAIIAKDAGGLGLFVVRYLQLGITLLVGAGFVYLGLQARQVKLWPYKVGIAAYAVDGMLLIWLTEWIGVLFHALVLLALHGGLRWNRALVEARGVVAPAGS